MKDRYPAAVIGAGPAGLATSRELTRRGIPHVVLERGEQVGHCWVNAYDSLRLHTGKHLSALPGMRFPRGTPLFPTRDHFVRYLESYARGCGAPVELGTEVTRVQRDSAWRISTNRGEIGASTLVIATGIMSNPLKPGLPGTHEYRGRLLHSVEYLRPGPFMGQRVLVIGVGNSGGEIASELANAGVDTTIAVRSGANVVPLKIGPVPVQYLAILVRKLPRAAQEWVIERIRVRNERKRPPVLPRADQSPLDAIPLIGFQLVDAIAEGRVALRGGVDRLTAAGARFADGRDEAFDAIILATGFRAALQPLNGLVRVDAKGFAVRTNRVRSADFADLFFVGHNYDASGGLRNIAIDSRLAAREIAALIPRAASSLR